VCASSFSAELTKGLNFVFAFWFGIPGELDIMTLPRNLFLQQNLPPPQPNASSGGTYSLSSTSSTSSGYPSSVASSSVAAANNNSKLPNGDLGMIGGSHNFIGRDLLEHSPSGLHHQGMTEWTDDTVESSWTPRHTSSNPIAHNLDDNESKEFSIKTYHGHNHKTFSSRKNPAEAKHRMEKESPTVFTPGVYQASFTMHATVFTA